MNKSFLAFIVVFQKLTKVKSPVFSGVLAPNPCHTLLRQKYDYHDKTSPAKEDSLRTSGEADVPQAAFRLAVD